ncbi:MAG: DUF1573 domain-containing protein [Anaerolineales bacterium]|nr:DUF1573 domain-containing protein [Anaerolineales bacterium]
MNKTAPLNRHETRERMHKRHKHPKNIQITIVATGLLLVAASIFWLVSQNKSSIATRTYKTEDVVYGQTLRATHEMDGPKLNQIPFLPKDGPQPQITLSEDFYDFGVIGPKDLVTYQFAIFNEGQEPLTISRAYTTCGCTVADFTTTLIPPGKVSLMTLIFDAGYHGDVAGQTVRRGVIIENNDPNNPQMEIWIQATIANK